MKARPLASAARAPQPSPPAPPISYRYAGLDHDPKTVCFIGVFHRQINKSPSSDIYGVIGQSKFVAQHAGIERLSDIIEYKIRSNVYLTLERHKTVDFFILISSFGANYFSSPPDP